MAIKEATRKESEDVVQEEQKKYLEEVIKASSKFERLLSNSDFLELLKDMEDVIKAHQEQINGFMHSMIGTSIFKQMRILSVIQVHQIRMEQLKEAIARPKQIVLMAQSAREEIKNMKHSIKKEVLQ